MSTSVRIDFGNDQSQIVGIDLGTTNSLVAVMDLTGPRIIPGATAINCAERGFGRRQRAK